MPENMESNNGQGSAVWCTATSTDLIEIQAIADSIHVDLHEHPEVFAEKLRLFPEGCFVLKQREIVVGYGFSYPWRLNSVPRLNQLLGRFPPMPECLFIHDVALAPQARGRGAVRILFGLLTKVARKRGLTALALVSVYNTHPLWARLGFQVVVDTALMSSLKTYGDLARYMVCRLG